ncbi:MAG: hypothetical protein ACKVII_18330 [Planctomycetales bacterium]
MRTDLRAGTPRVSFGPLVTPYEKLTTAQDAMRVRVDTRGTCIWPKLDNAAGIADFVCCRRPIYTYHLVKTHLL